MKEFGSRKATMSLVLSCVAIILCLLVFVLWAFEVIPHSLITPDTFIGACVALLGVIVTVAVGWQIYNAIEVKEKIAEIDRLQQKQNGQEHRMEQMYCNSSRVLGYAMSALAENRHDYVNAMRWLLSSLKFSLLQDNPQDIADMLSDMQQFVNAMPENTSVAKNCLAEISEHDKEIRSHSMYKVFAPKYESILEEFSGKIKVED